MSCSYTGLLIKRTLNNFHSGQQNIFVFRIKTIFLHLQNFEKSFRCIEHLKHLNVLRAFKYIASFPK